jgi:CRISPR system Cascade subunit CasB
MSGFIAWLEDLNAKDTKARAVLKRSLSFEPGTFPAAYPYVEPFVKDSGDGWNREVHYLVAALWAMHWREGRCGNAMTIGEACATYSRLSGSSSIERRFISLLDADRDQLPYRLRQMVAVLKDQPIDFDALLKDLKFWNDEKKGKQNCWARDFYRNAVQEPATESNLSEESAE